MGKGQVCRKCGLRSESCQCVSVGDRVRFREVVDPGDDRCRFEVVEDNGDRLMLRLICDLTIPPISVVQTAEVCKAID